MFEQHSDWERALSKPREFWEMTERRVERASDELSPQSRAAIAAGVVAGALTVMAIWHFDPDVMRYLKIERM